MSEKWVTCEKHGQQEGVFVCNHLHESLADGLPRGLFMWRDEQKRMCAWCRACQTRAAMSKTGENREPLQFKVETLCVYCFDPIRMMNGGGAWNQ